MEVFHMIQNINPFTFQPFGIILPENAAAPQLPPLFPFPLESARLYTAATPTWLRCEAGLAVLSLALPDGSFRDLLLDKAIRLNADIPFAITFPNGQGTVFVSQTPCPTERLLPARDLQLLPSLRLKSLYTFFYQEKEQGFLFPGEAHPISELTYVDQGSLHSVAEGMDLLLNQGDLVLYGPDQWHTQYADVDVAPRFITVTFDAGDFDFTPVLNRKFSCTPQIAALLQQMLREQELSLPFSGDMILNHLHQLLLLLLRQSGQPAHPNRPAHCLNSENRIINEALKFITDNVRSPLSVPVVAKGANVSPSYLTSLFHKHLQISPGEYIRRIKLQEGKQLIREGKLNFTQIAQVLQYSTVHHFSLQFKEKFGITPSQYAKSLK